MGVKSRTHHAQEEVGDGGLADTGRAGDAPTVLGTNHLKKYKFKLFLMPILRLDLKNNKKLQFFKEIFKAL